MLHEDFAEFRKAVFDKINELKDNFCVKRTFSTPAK